MKLKTGDCFRQSYLGCANPMRFKTLSVDRDNNSLRVECHKDGYAHEETWDDLDFTETTAFEIGEYTMIEPF